MIGLNVLDRVSTYPPTIHHPVYTWLISVSTVIMMHIESTNNQGGWDPQTGTFYREINAQIDQAFKNVELALKTAGGKSWEQVFRVNSYHVPINNEALDAMVRNFRNYMPNHEPLWTCVGVSRLGEDDMRVEVEVVAHDPR